METTDSNFRHSDTADHHTSNETREKLTPLFHQTNPPLTHLRTRRVCNKHVLVLTFLTVFVCQLSGACEPTPPCESCASLSTVADPANCTKYFTCSRGRVYAPQRCNRGIYSSALHTCVAGDERTCKEYRGFDKTTTTEPPATTSTTVTTRRMTTTYFTRRTSTGRPVVVELPRAIGGPNGINSGEPIDRSPPSD